MLQPKRTKYRRVQKGRMKGVSQRGHETFEWYVWYKIARFFIYNITSN